MQPSLMRIYWLAVATLVTFLIRGRTGIDRCPQSSFCSLIPLSSHMSNLTTGHMLRTEDKHLNKSTNNLEMNTCTLARLSVWSQHCHFFLLGGNQRSPSSLPSITLPPPNVSQNSPGFSWAYLVQKCAIPSNSSWVACSLIRDLDEGQSNGPAQLG